MRRLFFLLTIITLVSACGTDNTPAEPPVPTEPPLIGGVDITSPKLGSVIYAETLFVTGTIEGVDAFRLHISTLNGDILFDGSISGVDGHWSREIVHNYNGEPVEAIILAKSTDSRVSLQYDERPILIASASYREDGLMGLILFPTEQQSVGGDSIQIEGTASGIPDNRLSISLRHDEGLIDKQVIILDNPYRIDARTWSGDLLTNNYQGIATIDIAYTDPETNTEQIIDSITVTIGSAAG
jgi:hypothetical protein